MTRRNHKNKPVRNSGYLKQRLLLILLCSAPACFCASQPGEAVTEGQSRVAAIAHLDLAEAYEAQGDRQNAIKELQWASDLSKSEDLNTQARLCLIYINLHEVPSAIRHCENYLTCARRSGTSIESLNQFSSLLLEMKASLVPTLFTNAPPKRYTEAQLQSEFVQRLGVARKNQVINPLCASASMTNWARIITSSGTNELQRAKAIFETLTRHIDGLESVPRTAKQVFEAWNSPKTSFHCEDYTYLYMALARAVGLETYFVSVSQVFSGRLELHACAGTFIGDKLLLVDPMYCRFGASHREFTVLNDVQAVAIYLSQLKSIAFCEMAAELSPELPIVQANLINELARGNRWSEARDHLRTLLKLDPQSWITIYTQALFTLHDKNFNETIGLLSKAVLLNTDSYAIWVVLGSAYSERGESTEARNCYVHALHCIASAEELSFAKERIAQLDSPRSRDSSAPKEKPLGSHLKN